MKDIIENNKLIADFMGIPKCDRCANCGSYKFGTAIYYTPEEMDYLLSWDWLMPVVDKIESIDGGYFKFEIEFRSCEVKDSRFEPKLTRKDKVFYGGGPKIHAAHQTVLKFIEWYNANN